jgi:hypothetical protein
VCVADPCVRSRQLREGVRSRGPHATEVAGSNVQRLDYRKEMVEPLSHENIGVVSLL